MGLKKKLKYIAAGALCVFSMGGVAIGTVAWFQTASSINYEYNIGGESVAAYFAYGNGSQEKPFGISTFTHLRNLAWLQYSGAFKNNNNEQVQYYFELANDIDCSGKSLPPIGTEEYPFIGHFSGIKSTDQQQTVHKIKNLVVSNKTTFSDMPATIENYSQPEIVGFFGVVGELNGKPAKKANDYDSSINELENFVLDSVTVESKTNRTLIGLAAGYVNGDMSNVKVDGTSKLDVDGAQNKTAKADIEGVNDLTHYGLVGYTTKVANQGNSYSQELSSYYHTGNAGGGSDSNWGGSVNFRAFNERLYSYLNSGSITIPDLYYNTESKYTNRIRYYQDGNENVAALYRVQGINGASTNNKNSNEKNNIMNAYYAQDPNSASVLYPLMGTFNNETVKFGSGTSAKKSSTVSVPGTIQPLIVNDSAVTADNNTGYLLSGHVKTTDNYSVTSYIPTITTASYEMRFICNATGDSLIEDYKNGSNLYSVYKGNNGPYPSFDNTKLEVLTNSTASYSASNYVYIKDDFNANHTPVTNRTKSDNTTPSNLNLKKYTTSRVALKGILEKSDGVSADYIHGLHFRGATSDNASVYINNTNTLTATNVKINGETITSDYTFPTSCINFNLKEEGIINLFAGSYHYTNTTSLAGTDSFMSLWQVNRTSNTSFTVQQIKRIFKSDDANASPKYIYDYTGTTTPSNATLVFDLGYLSNTPPVQHAVYYFELPVNAGEYAIGVSDKKAGGAYLMYLDIGTNGEKTNEISAYSILTKTNGYSYPIGVDFAVVNAGTSGGDSFGIYIPTNKKGEITFDITSTQITVGGSTEIINQTTYSMSIFRFKGRNYSDSAAANKFVIGTTSPPPQPQQSISDGGQRILCIKLIVVGQTDTTYNIKVIDNLDANGSIVSSSYELDTGFGYTTSSYDAINSLGTNNSAFTIDPSSADANNVRNLAKAATLTRTSGTGQFVTEYNLLYCTATVLDVSITTNGTTMSVVVESGYTLKIGSNTYTSASQGVYPTA